MVNEMQSKPMNKRAYCEMIVAEFCKENNIHRNDLRPSDILKSSKLAVAMEYLGLLEGDWYMKEYASHRAGVITMHLDLVDEYNMTMYMLTVRDMLNLLPE